MKKFVLAALAASLVATPALAAPQRSTHSQTTVQHRTNGKVVVTKKKVVRQQHVQNHKWQKGQRFDSRYARNYRQVDYRQFHGRLKAPPRGYHYVQSGNDVVLVGITSGIIAAVLANILN